LTYYEFHICLMMRFDTTFKKTITPTLTWKEERRVGRSVDLLGRSVEAEDPVVAASPDLVQLVRPVLVVQRPKPMNNIKSKKGFQWRSREKNWILKNWNLKLWPGAVVIASGFESRQGATFYGKHSNAFV
jgi:hypothetical protein